MEKLRNSLIQKVDPIKVGEDDDARRFVAENVDGDTKNVFENNFYRQERASLASSLEEILRQRNV